MGEFGEGAVELGEGLEAGLESDVGDATGGFEQFLTRPVDAGAREIISKGEADSGFEKTGEVGFTETRDLGGSLKVDRLAEIFLNVFESFDDRGGDAAFDASGEVFGLAADLLGKDVEQGNHVGIALGFDRFGVEVAVLESLDLDSFETEEFELLGELLEVLARGFLLENLARF